MGLRLVPRAALSALLAGAVGGCMLDSGNPPPAPPLPAAIENTAPGGAPIWPAADWWTRFNVGELDALIEAAQAANPDLGAATARVRQADAQVRVVGGNLIPQLDLSADATRSRAARAPGSTTTPRVRTNLGASLSASYEIDFWGRNLSQVRAAEATAEAVRFERQTIALTVVTGVANAYFQITAFRERLRIARDNLANAERVLAAIQARVQVGTATALDLAQQQGIVAQQRANIPPLEQQLRQTANALAILAGRLPEGFATRPAPIERIAIPAVAPGLPSDLLLRRPDVQALEAQLAAADADISAARAAFFPSIVLTGQAGLQTAALASLFTPGAGFFSLGVNILQPLLQIFTLRAALDQNRARYAELLENYRGIVLLAFGDVEDSLIAVQQTAETERRQQEVVAVAQRAYQIAQARLREGTVDIVTVLTTQQTLFQALDARVQARLARLLAAVSLYKALGGGWTNPAPRPRR